MKLYYIKKIKFQLRYINYCYNIITLSNIIYKLIHFITCIYQRNLWFIMVYSLFSMI